MSKKMHIRTGFVAMALVASGATSASAQQALSFEDARLALLSNAEVLRASRAGVDAAVARAASSRALRRPQVDFEARLLESRKTVDVSLAPIEPFLSQVPISGLEIPGNLRIVDEGQRFRPQISATMPLYSGGQIEAMQAAASAGVEQAKADATLTEHRLLTRLVDLYYGAQLAQHVVRAREAALAGLDRHLRDAQASERAGVISRAQRLQIEVARDEGARALVRSRSDAANAQLALAAFLGVEATATPTSQLFVISTGLGDVDDYRASARTHPQLEMLAAIARQSGEAVHVERASRLPQVYAFAQYDLYPQDATLVEPDWVVGVGVRYRFLSSVDRASTERAAQARRRQAEASLAQARTDTEVAVDVAYNDANTAASEFSLFESSLALANENLRLQQISFREGVATAADIIDAQSLHTRAEVGRVEAAYRFDVALARLLAASGQAQRFEDFAMRADQVVRP